MRAIRTYKCCGLLQTVEVSASANSIWNVPLCAECGRQFYEERAIRDGGLSKWQELVGECIAMAVVLGATAVVTVLALAFFMAILRLV